MPVLVTTTSSSRRTPPNRANLKWEMSERHGVSGSVSELSWTSLGSDGGDDGDGDDNGDDDGDCAV